MRSTVKISLLSTLIICMIAQVGCTVVATYQPVQTLQFMASRQEIDTLVSEIRAPLEGRVGVTSYYSREHDSASTTADLKCGTLPLLILMEVPNGEVQSSNVKSDYFLQIYPMNSIDMKSSDSILRAVEKYTVFDKNLYREVRVRPSADDVFKQKTGTINLDDECL